MAVARPVRALGLATLLLFFYIVYLLLKSPGEVPVSGSGDLEREMPDEPMLKGRNIPRIVFLKD